MSQGRGNSKIYQYKMHLASLPPMKNTWMTLYLEKEEKNLQA